MYLVFKRGCSLYLKEDAPLVEFVYLVFTRMRRESYRKRLGPLLLCSCEVFRAQMNSLCLLRFNEFLVLVFTVNECYRYIITNLARNTFDFSYMLSIRGIF